MAEIKFPTEEVELPSKGLIYPKDNPLSNGKVEMKYMTAKEEDILTNQNYIRKGVVLDKLLKSLIVSDVNYDDLVVGDKNAILIAARILGYGKDYDFQYNGEQVSIDLTELETQYISESSLTEGVNEFSFTLPHTKTPITYKLLTNRDERKIDAEIKGLKKIDKQASPELSTRLKYVITSVNGETEKKDIRDFVDNHMLARDSRSFREHIKITQPDIKMQFAYNGDNGVEEDATVPMTAGFFWPDL
tara:strand:- start:360 stop:1097 length:738 start_codon:yes stop_codon:yes gene_type:complete